MRRYWVLVTTLALGACGRIGFDEQSASGGDAPGDGGVQGRPFVIELAEASDLRDVAVLPDGGAVVVGGVVGSTTFGTEALVGLGGSDVLIAAVAPDGAVRWANLYGGVGNDGALAVDVAPDGTIYMTGVVVDSASLGGAMLPAVGSDVFVASYTPEGTHLWSRVFGGADIMTTPPSDFGAAIVIAPDGDVIVGGSADKDVDFGAGVTPASSATYDAFVARYSGDGTTLRWARRYGVQGENTVEDVAVDASGGVYASGGYMGAVDFGGGGVPSRGGLDAFLLALTPSGSYAWNETFGGGNYERLYGVEVVNDTVIASGYYWDTIDLGGVPSSSGLADGIVRGFSLGGSELWTTYYGGTACDYITNAGLVDGQAAMVGTFGKPLDLGDGLRTPIGGTDNLVFVASPAAGDVTWSAAFGDSTDEIAHGVAGSRTTGVFVVGSRNRTWDGGCYTSTSTAYLRRL